MDKNHLRAERRIGEVALMDAWGWSGLVGVGFGLGVLGLASALGSWGWSGLRQLARSRCGSWTTILRRRPMLARTTSWPTFVGNSVSEYHPNPHNGVEITSIQ